MVPSMLPRLRDSRGRVIVLRGTNVVGASKIAPDFLPPNFETPADFRRLRDELGFNAIRFLVFWEAMEPTQGTYDIRYLDAIRARIQAASDAGLLVLIDMHQDVFGRGFNSDGAPLWACDQALYDAFQPPPSSQWYFGYLSTEVAQCFRRLYTDETTRGAFSAAWARVAEAVRDVPGVLGYEVLNEPHWADFELVEFETVVLPTFYSEVIDSVRTVDPDRYVFLEPSSLVNLGAATHFVPPDRDRLVFAPHIYPSTLEQGMPWTGDQATADALLAPLVAAAAERGLPLAVTELGVRGNVEGATAFLEQIWNSFDAAGASAFQWDAGRGPYGLFTMKGTPSELAMSIARPSPDRVSGEPRTWSWDDAAGVFSFEWLDDGVAETELSAPSLAFPRGFEVELEGTFLILDSRVVIAPGTAGTLRRVRLQRR